MAQMELTVLDWIQAHLRCGVLDVLAPFFTRLGEYGAVWIALAVLLLIIPKTRKLGLAVAAALILDLLLCNLLLKPLIARPRPFTYREITLLIPAPTDYSFPSGHAAASFAAVGALFFSRSRGWIPAAVLAVIISLTRLYLYVHFPSDVICGILLGILCGLGGALLVKYGTKAVRKHQT